MSWDVNFSSLDAPMGTKAAVRECFLAACEQILGTPIQREGPTEVIIDDSFRYETLFIGNKHAIVAFGLSIKILDGAPHEDDLHPVWKFIRQITAQTGWQAQDTYNGKVIE